MKKGSKKQEVLEKYQLLQDVKQRLLASQRLMGAVAESTNKEVSTLKNQLIGDSPILAHPKCVDAIRTALGIPADQIIYELVPVGDKSLHVD